MCLNIAQSNGDKMNKCQNIELLINRYCHGAIDVTESTTAQVTQIKPWLVSLHYQDIDKICVVDVLPYLTNMEADTALVNWFKTLKINGVLHLELPDLDVAINQWLNANWDEDSITNRLSDARQSTSAIFGVQENCNPAVEGYEASYTNVHKSGYNTQRLTFLLTRIGFVDVEVESKAGRLVAAARKSMDKSERQVAPSYSNIRQDHLNRYQFACQQLESNEYKNILDLACGIGYGSLMLSNRTNSNVLGVDIDSNAIDYANTHYAGKQVDFLCADALTINKPNFFDAVVSFETIEHVDFDVELLTKFNSVLKTDGLLICSSPNQTVMPFDKEKFKYHIKHYTLQEITELLSDTGFKVLECYKQSDKTKGIIEFGDNGCFFVLVCKKVR